MTFFHHYHPDYRRILIEIDLLNYDEANGSPLPNALYTHERLGDFNPSNITKHFLL